MSRIKLIPIVAAALLAAGCEPINFTITAQSIRSSLGAAGTQPSPEPSASPSPSPRPSASSTPVGNQVLFQEEFEDANLASRGWYDDTQAALSSAAPQLAGSTHALEFLFLQGAKTPSQGKALRHLFSPSSSVYVSYYVRYSSNWVGSEKPYHPHEFLLMTTLEDAYAGPSFTHLTGYIEQNGGTPLLAIQDGKNVDQNQIGKDLTALTEERGVAGCNGAPEGLPEDCYKNGDGLFVNGKTLRASSVAFTDDPASAGYKSNWHHVEAYFQLNSIGPDGKGQRDGVLRYWFDGKLLLDRSDIYLRTGANASMKFNQLLIAPYIGDGSPIEQTMWVDRLTVATSPIGAEPTPTPSSTVGAKPGDVTDLRVTSATADSMTLQFTEVDNGQGQPAHYDVRVAPGTTMSWGSAPSVTQGTCKTSLAGSQIGALLSCTITGLSADTAYQVQLVPYRGTLNQDAVFGKLSNVASGRTQAAPISDPIPPPPSSSSSVWPDEPSGMQALTDNPFDQMPGTSSGVGANWWVYDPDHHFSIVSDLTAPISPSNVIQMLFPQGFHGGSGPGQLNYGDYLSSKFINKGELFIAYAWKSSPTWTEYEGAKHFYAFQQNGSDRQATFLAMNGPTNGPFRVKICSEPTGKCYYPPAGVPELTVGQWHRIEVYLKKSSADGASDGIIRWWVDGVPAGNYTGLAQPSQNFSQVSFAPIWESFSTYQKPGDEYFRFDDIHVSGR